MYEGLRGRGHEGITHHVEGLGGIGGWRALRDAYLRAIRVGFCHRVPEAYGICEGESSCVIIVERVNADNIIARRKNDRVSEGEFISNDDELRLDIVGFDLESEIEIA